MEREQDLQFLGFFGIIKESFHVIFASRKIICKIAIALLFPLSAIFLVHVLFTELIFSTIYHSSQFANNFPTVSSKNSNVYGATDSHDVVAVTASQVALFWLFRFAYVIFTLVFSLFSTSAMVYTVACFYMKKEITFRKVLKTALKVWLRLIVTFFWFFVFVFALTFVFGLLALLFVWIISLGQYGIGIAVFVVLTLLYLIAFVYLTIVWQLASVVSILETVYGLKAMVKSNDLIKGKIIVSATIFITLVIFFFIFQILFENLIAPTNSRNLGVRIPVGVLFCLLLMKILLFGLVAQTVVYFVCKSYHHEAIDKSSLSAHLDEDRGNHVRSDSNAVQLEVIIVEQKD